MNDTTTPPYMITYADALRVEFMTADGTPYLFARECNCRECNAARELLERLVAGEEAAPETAPQSDASDFSDDDMLLALSRLFGEPIVVNYADLPDFEEDDEPAGASTDADVEALRKQIAKLTQDIEYLRKDNDDLNDELDKTISELNDTRSQISYYEDFQRKLLIAAVTGEYKGWI